MQAVRRPARCCGADLLTHPEIVVYALVIIVGGLLMLAAFIAAPPAVLLLVFGIWACLLTQRRVRASRYRWVRYATDVLIATLTGLDLLVLFDHDLLATLPVAGLFFPVGVWLSIRTWRVMAGSRRPAVRAGADIALSLLLGIDLVLFPGMGGQSPRSPRG
jgi:hypothetical protein